jgi:hypothetical protein
VLLGSIIMAWPWPPAEQHVKLGAAEGESRSRAQRYFHFLHPPDPPSESEHTVNNWAGWKAFKRVMVMEQLQREAWLRGHLACCVPGIQSPALRRRVLPPVLGLGELVLGQCLVVFSSTLSDQRGQ